MIFLRIIKHSHGEKEHDDNAYVCRHAYAEIGDTAYTSRKGPTPHECKDGHYKHAACWIRDVSQRVFARIENVLVGVVDPQGGFFHVTFLIISVSIYGEYER